MARARRVIRENLKLVDAVVEMRDARIPLASGHPGLAALLAGKRTLLVLNRVDLADPAAVAEFIGRRREEGQEAVAADSRSGRGVAAAVRLLRDLAGRGGASAQRARPGRDLRCMVVGLPNVGKSSFINRVAGKRAAPAAARPGVTRGIQWIRLAPGLDLLDTPGVLWPEGITGETFYKLAACGILAPGAYDPGTVALWLRGRLAAARPEVYPPAADDFLISFGFSRGFLRAGGGVDETRAAVAFLAEFRAGRLGRFTFDP